MQKARDRRQSPRYLQAAQSLYGAAFEVRGPADLRDAMVDWASLTPEQRGYATAHLLYLNLQAHAVTQRLLSEIRDAADDLVDDTEALVRVGRARGEAGTSADSNAQTSTPMPPTPSEPSSAAESDADVPDPASLAESTPEPQTLAELFGQTEEETR